MCLKERRRREGVLLNSGCEQILNCLLGELERKIDVERRNYLCRECAEKLKNYKEKKEELLSLLRESFPYINSVIKS